MTRTHRATALGRSALAEIAATRLPSVDEAVRAIVGAYDLEGFTTVSVTSHPRSITWRDDGSAAPVPAYTVARLRSADRTALLLRIVEEDGAETRIGPSTCERELRRALRDLTDARLARARSSPQALPT